ncbi:hypothetical protein N7474_003091 [Penicillium riverlandense]|uniref:uncharacterized protein n=1 Tax=Penicillium riverlandense TaxID=1903569 RepID=UPI002546AD95|nr:uncharacterized protein N7474_003091 [Penicillium riverlandense]KAJ5825953.1 hypothetical protein N7474_003091 [Penicillium riverlandense]
MGLASSRNSILLPGLSVAFENTSEKRSLYFFWLAAENDISRHFGDNFWARLVMQTAHAYPVVQYAVHATGVLYETYITRSDGDLLRGLLDSPTSHTAMLRNKALKLLSDQLQMGRLPRQVVLMCCLLFVWLELLRNDFEAAITHLKSGLRILQDMEQQQQQPQAHTSASHSGSNPPLKDVDRAISHMFTRLQVQVTIHGCPGSEVKFMPTTSPFDTSIQQVPSSFRDVAEARDSLDNIATYAFRLIRQKQQFEPSQRPEPPISRNSNWPLLIRARDSYLAHLEQWHTALQKSMHLIPEIKASSPAILLLRINYTMAVMVMKNLFTESELAYDRYNVDFDQLVGLAEAILRNSRRETFGSALSLDTGVLPCLFYTSLKCRDTAIRRRALHVLELAPEREGLWHRDSIIAAATWKMSIEEQWWSMADPVAQQLPGSLRIYREKVTSAGIQKARANVRFAGGPPGSSDIEWEVSRLLYRFGDTI